MFRRRRAYLSDSEADLLLRLDAGHPLDIHSVDFHRLLQLIHLKLVNKCEDTSTQFRCPQLTDLGRERVAGLKARRWVEEHSR